MGNKFKSRKKASYDRKSKNLADRSPKREPFIVFSFRYFDRNQGQSFKDWEENSLLAKVCEKLSSISQLTVLQATQQQIIKVYTKIDFPPNSAFTHPVHVPDDIKWASLHVQGKECVIGFFEDCIFHIVFLDKEHEFWISKKKNT